MDFTDLDDDDKDSDYKPESESEDDLELSRDSPADNKNIQGLEGIFKTVYTADFTKAQMNLQDIQSGKLKFFTRLNQSLQDRKKM
jgi:hypothetical protein